MTKRIWTLADRDADVYVDHLTVGPADVEGDATGYHVTKRTLRGGRSEGVDVIEVDNGAFATRLTQPAEGDKDVVGGRGDEAKGAVRVLPFCADVIVLDGGVHSEHSSTISSICLGRIPSV